MLASPSWPLHVGGHEAERKDVSFKPIDRKTACCLMANRLLMYLDKCVYVCVWLIQAALNKTLQSRQLHTSCYISLSLSLRHMSAMLSMGFYRNCSRSIVVANQPRCTRLLLNQWIWLNHTLPISLRAPFLNNPDTAISPPAWRRQTPSAVMWIALESVEPRLSRRSLIISMHQETGRGKASPPSAKEDYSDSLPLNAFSDSYLFFFLNKKNFPPNRLLFFFLF